MNFQHSSTLRCILPSVIINKYDYFSVFSFQFRKIILLIKNKNCLEFSETQKPIFLCLHARHKCFLQNSLHTQVSKSSIPDISSLYHLKKMAKEIRMAHLLVIITGLNMAPKPVFIISFCNLKIVFLAMPALGYACLYFKTFLNLFQSVLTE